jgi:hypothetical protein
MALPKLNLPDPGIMAKLAIIDEALKDLHNIVSEPNAMKFLKMVGDEFQRQGAHTAAALIREAPKIDAAVQKIRKGGK